MCNKFHTNPFAGILTGQWIQGILPGAGMLFKHLTYMMLPDCGGILKI
jgi:hypothetical protein